MTTFHFADGQDLSRWLLKKEYADATSVQYGRSPDGKLETRTWARLDGANPLVTTYDYYDDASEALTGELQKVDYSDATKDVEYTAYTRLGQPKTVVDVVGTRTFAYNAYGELVSETIDGTSGGLYSRVITRKHEESLAGRLGRDIGFDIGVSGDLDQDYDVDYAYEPKTTSTGRLLRINGPGLPEGLPNYSGGAFYGYTANSDLVGSLTYKDTSGTAVASATRVYEASRDLVDYLQNDTTSTVSKYDYASDGAGRRTSVVYTGSAFDPHFHVDFGYNDRGELTAADRRQGTTPGQGDHLAAIKHAFDYTYDPIGNRESYQLDGGTATTYTTNDVNQYTGTADPTEYFCYDADGNLVADGKPTSNCETADSAMTYVWNAENRLIEAYPTTPATNDKKVEFKYDYLGRRVEKKVSIYTGGQWVVDDDRTQRFVYDGPALDTPGTGGSQGWNVALVLNGAGSTQQKYTWGLDLSGLNGRDGTEGIHDADGDLDTSGGRQGQVGGLHGAGGIGGLLAVEETAAQGSPAYWYFYDGNGNVGQVLEYDTNPSIAVTLAAHYEYDPYGNIITADDVDSSGYVDANAIRFSTKPFDAEIGAYYYIFRYYNPRLGGWLNRDPIEEEGGNNLYAALANDPVTNIDPIGQKIPSPWPYKYAQAGLELASAGAKVFGDMAACNQCALSRPTASRDAFWSAPPPIQIPVRIVLLYTIRVTWTPGCLQRCDKLYASVFFRNKKTGAMGFAYIQCEQ